jgi:TRAP-type C4-dicarboxylate transport system permease small subunit
MFDRAVNEATRILHVLAALWLCLISPLTGTAEIVANSIVAIAFLQIPFAIRTYGMLRTTVVMEKLGTGGRRIFNVVTYIVGVVVFATIAWASWDSMVFAWSIGEYEGEGALRVPTYPVRAILVAMSAVASLAYLLLCVRELRGEGPAHEQTINY